MFFKLLFFIISPVYFVYSNHHRLVFGSCNNANRKGLWPIISSLNPSKLVLLGDNIYLDDRMYKRLTPLEKLNIGYKTFKDDIEWQALFLKLDGWNNIHATYDDHDFGEDNSDKTLSYRHLSQEHFWNFLDVPLTSFQRKQNGVYSSHISTFQTISGSIFTYKLILLDLRSNRDSKDTPNGEFLGIEQTEWFLNQLNDAYIYDLILIGSSLQVLRTDGLVEESWFHFPIQRERLLQLISFIQSYTNIILLSGDIHHAEVSQAYCQSISLSSSPYQSISATSSSSSSLLSSSLSSSSSSADIKSTRTPSSTTTTTIEKSASSSSSLYNTKLWEFTSSGLTHTFSHVAIDKSPPSPPPNNISSISSSTHIISQQQNDENNNNIIEEKKTTATHKSHMKLSGKFKNFVMNFYQAIYPRAHRERHYQDYYAGLHIGMIDFYSISSESTTNIQSSTANNDNNNNNTDTHVSEHSEGIHKESDNDNNNIHHINNERIMLKVSTVNYMGIEVITHNITLKPKYTLLLSDTTFPELFRQQLYDLHHHYEKLIINTYKQRHNIPNTISLNLRIQNELMTSSTQLLQYSVCQPIHGLVPQWRLILAKFLIMLPLFFIVTIPLLFGIWLIIASILYIYYYSSEKRRTQEVENRIKKQS